MNVLGFCHTPQKRRHFFEHSITPHFPSSSKTTSFTAQQGKKGKGVFFLTTICFSSPMSPTKRGGFLYAVIHILNQEEIGHGEEGGRVSPSIRKGGGFYFF
jgi:hypothetical protein